MSIRSCWKSAYQGVIAFGSFLQPFLLLAMRFYWGGSFMIGGWKKLHKIASIADYFGTLHIPFPLFNAYLVGGLECICGFLLLIGLVSRLAAIPLIVITIVAYLTAHFDSVANAWHEPNNFIKQSPFNYLLMSLIVLAFGPGKFSLDYFTTERPEKNILTADDANKRK